MFPEFPEYGRSIRTHRRGSIQRRECECPTMARGMCHFALTNSMVQANAKYKAIVFDFGGVLIDWNPRYLYLKFFDGDLPAMEDYLAKINFTEWNLRQDEGRPWSEGIAELCAQFPEYQDLIRAYDEHWEDSIAGVIQPTVDILRSLKNKGHPLYGMTNWSREKFRLVRPKYEFFDWFQAIVVSGEVRLVKPDPRIFMLFLEMIGRTAGECLLVDDSAANIAAARQLGFNTIHYQAPGQLEAALRQMDVIK
jgi:2-haloacid dehalogenase